MFIKESIKQCKNFVNIFLLHGAGCKVFYVLLIFLPIFFSTVSFSFGEGSGEKQERPGVAVDISGLHEVSNALVCTWSFRRSDSVFQGKDFWIESSPELSSSFVEFRKFVNIEGGSITNEASSQSPYDCESSSDVCCFTGTKIQLITSIFVGLIGGLVIVWIILEIIFYIHRNFYFR